MKEKETCEEKTKLIQDVLDAKTSQLAQHLNQKNAQNTAREKDRDRARKFILERCLRFHIALLQ